MRNDCNWQIKSTFPFTKYGHTYVCLYFVERDALFICHCKWWNMHKKTKCQSKIHTIHKLSIMPHSHTSPKLCQSFHSWLTNNNKHNPFPNIKFYVKKKKLVLAAMFLLYISNNTKKGENKRFHHQSTRQNARQG